MRKVAKIGKPFYEEEIMHVPCFRCGKPSYSQWQICSDARKFRPLCFRCDIELNELVLNFMKFPDAEKLLSDYLVTKMLEYREVRGEFPAGYLTKKEEKELNIIFKKRRMQSEK